MKTNTMLSIIIPVFNEKKTIERIINKILRIKFIKKQIILVDDGSTDGTSKLIKEKYSKNKMINKIIYHNKNKGKGAAIKTAQKYVLGDIVIIQDADLEYNPNDYKKIISPIIKKKTGAVYGSRVLNKNRYFKHNFSSILRVFANHILTIISNIINEQKLTDAHTCYKAFDAKIFKKIKLNENGFSFCPEITTKLSCLKVEITEVEISYNGRSFDDGKKIKFSDGFDAIITLIRYKFFN